MLLFQSKLAHFTNFVSQFQGGGLFLFQTQFFFSFQTSIHSLWRQKRWKMIMPQILSYKVFPTPCHNTITKYFVWNSMTYPWKIKNFGVDSPAQYLQVLWQYSVSIVVILKSIEAILEKCVHLQVQYSWVLSQVMNQFCRCF